MRHQLSQSTNPIVHLTFFTRTNGERFLFSAVSFRMVQQRSISCRAIKALLSPQGPVRDAFFYIFLIFLCQAVNVAVGPLGIRRNTTQSLVSFT
jgi:hypothetical protein